MLAARTCGPQPISRCYVHAADFPVEIIVIIMWIKNENLFTLYLFCYNIQLFYNFNTWYALAKAGTTRGPCPGARASAFNYPRYWPQAPN